MDCPVEAKRALRARIRAERAALSDAERTDAADRVRDRLLALRPVAQARTVMVYAASAEELSLDSFAESLSDAGVTVGFPLVEGAFDMSIRRIDPRDEESFVSGAFGIREPVADAPLIEPAAVDCVIVPGLAFTEDGRRIGYGGGFYDNLLPRLRAGCVRIAVGFDLQGVSDLPCEEHDERVDLVVTPSATRVTGARGCAVL